MPNAVPASGVTEGAAASKALSQATVAPPINV